MPQNNRNTFFKPSTAVQIAIAGATGALTTLPIYPKLSWETGQKINELLHIDSPLLQYIAPTATAICSGTANFALATDKVNDVINRLPELVRFAPSWGDVGHGAVDLAFVAAAGTGAISLANITYEMYEKNIKHFAAIPAGLVVLGRLIIGTSALVDLKNNMLWWVNVLRNPNFKAKEELILLLNDIEPLLQRCSAEEIANLNSELQQCNNREQALKYFITFANDKNVALKSLRLFDASLLIKLLISVVIGAPASIIYYHKALTGIASTLNLSTHDVRSVLLAGSSVLPILTLQGMASQRAIYEIGQTLYRWLSDNCYPSNIYHKLVSYQQTFADCGQWLKDKLAFRTLVNGLTTAIGIGSAAAAIQIAITAANNSIPLMLLYIPPAALAGALTNLLSMYRLINKIGTSTTEDQREIIDKLQNVMGYLNELYTHSNLSKIIDLREQDYTLEHEETPLLNQSLTIHIDPQENLSVSNTPTRAGDEHSPYYHQRHPSYSSSLRNSTSSSIFSMNSQSILDTDDSEQSLNAGNFATKSRCTIC